MQPINKRRHSGHMHGGGGGRRPYGQQHGGGQGRQGGGGFQRGGAPRKNFAALREKFMNMAKDAMSQGDRVLAEYYLQHADHYFRAQQEFLAERAASQRLNPPQNGNGNEQQQDENGENEGSTNNDADMNMPNNSNVLPAFLTQQVQQQPQRQGEDKSQNNGNWEEE